jgi:poly(beta-D-mannuronate) lyase
MGNGIWTDQEITFKGAGTSTNRITLKAETPGRVILNGKSRLHLGGSYTGVDGLLWFHSSALEPNQCIVEFRITPSPSTYADHASLINCAFIDVGVSSSFQYNWVNVYGQNNRVANNFFTGQKNKGVTICAFLTEGTSANHLISNNYFGERPRGPTNGYEAIRLGESKRQAVEAHITVQRNLFEGTNGEDETISVKSSNNVIKNNTFRNVVRT